MTTNPVAKNPEQAEESVASVDRRRMLKASALAAPVIATLPNSAALANASSAQCIKTDYDATHETPVAKFRKKTDRYVQVEAYKVTLKENGGKGPKEKKNVIKVNGIYYKKRHGVWDEFDVPGKKNWTEVVGSKKEGYVHAIFEPRDADLITVNTTDPTDVVRVADWPAQDLKDADNMLLSGSCWSSLNPMANGG